ncbi:unnamed protein product [Aureobasidium vineae]|uniref:Uncharacterized protein n=1 Tax=Aureobasidium vineae TaxID=2773715 RepID=A0A9N8PH44_9PEZI|nr:unnamed protein product [Aureobasidium vineae]
MEQLNLPILEYAEAIANTLATLHWDAEIDANDVEFVLGTRRQLDVESIQSLSSAYIANQPYNYPTRRTDDASRLEPSTQLQEKSTDLQVW